MTALHVGMRFHVKSALFCLILLLLGGCFSPQGKPLPSGTTFELKPPTPWTGPDRLKLWDEGKWFMVGVNYPWLHYGHDFGHASPWTHDGVSNPESMRRIDSDFSYLAKAGVHIIRWFIFGDGRASPEFDADGNVVGLEELFYKDMDQALFLAARHNIYLIPVLLDFHIARPAKTESGGVQLGGRAALFLPEHRATFFKNALKPLLERYGKHKNIFAWEIMNEPEGAMRLKGKEDDDHPVDPEVMQSFVKEVVKFIQNHSDQRVTVGSKSRKYLHLWVDSGVDFYQYHHYDRLEKVGYPLDYSYAKLDGELKLKGKPTILGEFPTASTERTLSQHFDIVFKNGYAGAWAWSYGASDEFSKFSQMTSEYTQWLQNYESQNPHLRQ